MSRRQGKSGYSRLQNDDEVINASIDTANETSSDVDLPGSPGAAYQPLKGTRRKSRVLDGLINPGQGQGDSDTESRRASGRRRNSLAENRRVALKLPTRPQRNDVFEEQFKLRGDVLASMDDNIERKFPALVNNLSKLCRDDMTPITKDQLEESLDHLLRAIENEDACSNELRDVPNTVEWKIEMIRAAVKYRRSVMDWAIGNKKRIAKYLDTSKLNLVPASEYTDEFKETIDIFQDPYALLAWRDDYTNQVDTVEKPLFISKMMEDWETLARAALENNKVLTSSNKYGKIEFDIAIANVCNVMQLCPVKLDAKSELFKQLWMGWMGLLEVVSSSIPDGLEKMSLHDELCTCLMNLPLGNSPVDPDLTKMWDRTRVYLGVDSGSNSATAKNFEEMLMKVKAYYESLLMQQGIRPSLLGEIYKALSELQLESEKSRLFANKEVAHYSSYRGTEMFPDVNPGLEKAIEAASTRCQLSTEEKHFLESAHAILSEICAPIGYPRDYHYVSMNLAEKWLKNLSAARVLEDLGGGFRISQPDFIKFLKDTVGLDLNEGDVANLLHYLKNKQLLVVEDGEDQVKIKSLSKHMETHFNSYRERIQSLCNDMMQYASQLQRKVRLRDAHHVMDTCCKIFSTFFPNVTLRQEAIGYWNLLVQLSIELVRSLNSLDSAGAAMSEEERVQILFEAFQLHPKPMPENIPTKQVRSRTVTHVQWALYELLRYRDHKKAVLETIYASFWKAYNQLDNPRELNSISSKDELEVYCNLLREHPMAGLVCKELGQLYEDEWDGAITDNAKQHRYELAERLYQEALDLFILASKLGLRHYFPKNFAEEVFSATIELKRRIGVPYTRLQAFMQKQSQHVADAQHLNPHNQELQKYGKVIDNNRDSQKKPNDPMVMMEQYQIYYSIETSGSIDLSHCIPGILSLNESYSHLFEREGYWKEALDIMLGSLRIYRELENDPKGAAASDGDSNTTHLKHVKAWQFVVRMCCNMADEKKSAGGSEEEEAKNYSDAMKFYQLALDVRPKRMHDSDHICDMIVTKMYTALDKGPATAPTDDMVSTDTESYILLQNMYSEYEHERKKSLGSLSSRHDPIGLGYNADNINKMFAHDDKIFSSLSSEHKQLLREKRKNAEENHQKFREMCYRYPHIPKIASRLALLVYGNNDFSGAVKFSSHALHAMCTLNSYTTGDIDKEWKNLVKYFAKTRSTIQANLTFLETEIARRKPFLPSNFPLLGKFEKRMTRLKRRGKIYDTYANAGLIFGGYLLVLALGTYAFFNADCFIMQETFTLPQQISAFNSSSVTNVFMNGSARWNMYNMDVNTANQSLFDWNWISKWCSLSHSFTKDCQICFKNYTSSDCIFRTKQSCGQGSSCMWDKESDSCVAYECLPVLDDVCMGLYNRNKNCTLSQVPCLCFDAQCRCNSGKCSCDNLMCDSSACWCLDAPKCTCDDFDCSMNCVLSQLANFVKKAVFVISFLPQIIEIGLFGFGLVLVKWPVVPGEDEKDRLLKMEKRKRATRSRCALMIATHKAEGLIRKTLEAALDVFEPQQIFICDNGNFPVPIDDIKGVCEQISREYFERHQMPPDSPPIHYFWVDEGNKSLAFWWVATYKCTYDYIMIIDHDVILPSDMVVPIELFEEDEETKALAFTIRAENLKAATGTTVCGVKTGRNMLLTHCQDLEYKKSGLMKLSQSALGSALYCHGAIAMWERDAMMRVFKEHNTMFHGEDLQMGVILLGFRKNYRINTVGQVCIPTVVPNHMLCFRHPLKCARGGCDRKEKSLFSQRMRSWDAASHRFFLVYLKILLLYWDCNTLPLKVFVFYEIWSIIMDWLRVPLLVMIVVDSEWLAFGTLFAIIYFTTVLLLHVFNYWTLRHRSDLKSRWYILWIFPMYNFILLFIRFFALWYNAMVYLPFERNKLPIRDRVKTPYNDQERQIIKHLESAISKEVTDDAMEFTPNQRDISRFVKKSPEKINFKLYDYQTMPVQEAKQQPWPSQHTFLQATWLKFAMNQIRSPQCRPCIPQTEPFDRRALKYDPQKSLSGEALNQVKTSIEEIQAMNEEEELPIQKVIRYFAQNPPRAFFYSELPHQTSNLSAASSLVAILNGLCFLSSESRCFGVDMEQAVRFLLWSHYEKRICEEVVDTVDAEMKGLVRNGVTSRTFAAIVEHAGLPLLHEMYPNADIVFSKNQWLVMDCAGKSLHLLHPDLGEETKVFPFPPNEKTGHSPLARISMVSNPRNGPKFDPNRPFVVFFPTYDSTASDSPHLQPMSARDTGSSRTPRKEREKEKEREREREREREAAAAAHRTFPQSYITVCVYPKARMIIACDPLFHTPWSSFQPLATLALLQVNSGCDLKRFLLYRLKEGGHLEQVPQWSNSIEKTENGPKLRRTSRVSDRVPSAILSSSQLVAPSWSLYAESESITRIDRGANEPALVLPLVEVFQSPVLIIVDKDLVMLGSHYLAEISDRLLRHKERMAEESESFGGTWMAISTQLPIVYPDILVFRRIVEEGMERAATAYLQAIPVDGRSEFFNLLHGFIQGEYKQSLAPQEDHRTLQDVVRFAAAKSTFDKHRGSKESQGAGIGFGL